MDSEDLAHVSHYDGFNKDLEYVRRAGPAWAIEDVDTTGITGQWTSLALDAQDRPHIAYFDWTDKAVQYAFKAAGTWTICAIDTVGGSGDYISLALDSAGNPHISYYDADAGDLRYAYGQLPTSVPDAPSGAISLLAYPNPTPGPLRIACRMPPGAAAELLVYDTTGRRVRSLLLGSSARGLRTITWNGLDAHGRAVAAGTYFLRLRAGAAVQSMGRVTVVR